VTLDEVEGFWSDNAAELFWPCDISDCDMARKSGRLEPKKPN